MAAVKSRSHSSPTSRTHIVLVPGFAGFDALGQMEYYAGVTPYFGKWKGAGGSKRKSTVLHYFDNFPTAGVKTRARRLRQYLAKRVARGEFLPGDRIALVGHSTGGLDIRQLLCDLATDKQNDAKKHYAVDGTQHTNFVVAPAQILRMVERVVFLSVPQFGTNIADWVKSHDPGRHAVVAELRASVAGSQVPVLDRLQEWLTGAIAEASKVDLFLAIRDALAEAEPPMTGDPMRKLTSQEAASELALWLRHTSGDFGAIEDLRARPQGDIVSPAHFNAAMREAERGSWRAHRVQTLSFASLGARPFEFDPTVPAPLWNLLNPWSYPETTRSTPARGDTDIVYRTCYRACAAGPFEFPDTGVALPPALEDENGQRHTIAVWDNDGIVNTASMLWPNGKETILVNADHMDIVGHHELVPSPGPQTGRRYDAYDLLKSGSGFDSNSFAWVWDRVFEFCVGDFEAKQAKDVMELVGQASR